MNYAIIKDAGPVPPRKSGTWARRSIYPFAEMEVGDAFDVPRVGQCADGSTDKAQRRVGSGVTAFEKRNPGTEFTARIWDETTVRCWRVA